jgi:DNA-binding Lrp family transcriptional regulator
MAWGLSIRKMLYMPMPMKEANSCTTAPQSSLPSAQPEARAIPSKLPESVRPEGSSAQAPSSASLSAARRAVSVILMPEAAPRAGSYRVADLAAALGVSEVSVGKSLDELEGQGIVRRYHGEARIYDGDDIPFRMLLRYDEKRLIAERAASIVEPGDTVLLEAGSAIARFAERIKEVRGLTVITSNLYIARSFRGSKTKMISHRLEMSAVPLGARLRGSRSYTITAPA